MFYWIKGLLTVYKRQVYFILWFYWLTLTLCLDDSLLSNLFKYYLFSSIISCNVNQLVTTLAKSLYIFDSNLMRRYLCGLLSYAPVLLLHVTTITWASLGVWTKKRRGVIYCELPFLHLSYHPSIFHLARGISSLRTLKVNDSFGC